MESGRSSSRAPPRDDRRFALGGACEVALVGQRHPVRARAVVPGRAEDARRRVEDRLDGRLRALLARLLSRRRSGAAGHSSRAIFKALPTIQKMRKNGAIWTFLPSMTISAPSIPVRTLKLVERRRS